VPRRCAGVGERPDLRLGSLWPGTVGEAHRLHVQAAEEWSVGTHPTFVAPDRDRQEACRLKTVRRVRIYCAHFEGPRCALNAHPTFAMQA